MSFKSLAWLLLIISALAILGYYNYAIQETVTILFILYLFLTGLIIEVSEIKAKEGLKAILAEKIGKLENLLSGTLQKLDSDVRIKERLNKKNREIIEWLSKL